MILITGGTGLVGAQLLFDLTQEGHEVIATIRESSNKQIVNRTFKNHKALLEKIKWVHADIMNFQSLCRALENITKVYHCAAYVSFDSQEANKVIEINIQGTANLVNACLEKGIERFCHVSSVAALGDEKINGKITEDSVLKNSKHNSTYSISKHGAEREVWRAQAEGLNCFMVSPCIILGRGDWLTGSSALFNKIYKGFPYYTNGISGFVDVRDVSRIMIQLMNNGVRGEKYIACSENISYRDVFSMIAKQLNKKEPYIKPPDWVSQFFWRAEYLRSKLSGHPPMITRETVQSSLQKRYFSNEKIKQKLNYEFIPVKQSIEDTCMHFLNDLNESN